jgi:hypothetical protein
VTWVDYEECYREALTLLIERGLKVGTPFRNADGKRSCKVSGETMADLEILTRAFGERVALQIFGERIDDP